MLGFEVLPRGTRLRTQNGLVRLDQLSGSGPQGPAGPSGPAGPAGTVYTSQFYTKAQADVLLASKNHLISSTAGSGTEVWDSANNMIRRLVAGTGTTLTLDANGNIVVTATGGSGGIPSTIATFTSSSIIHKEPTTCNRGLTVAKHVGI